jgi:hypothetical protein
VCPVADDSKESYINIDTIKPTMKRGEMEVGESPILP